MDTDSDGKITLDEILFDHFNTHIHPLYTKIHHMYTHISPYIHLNTHLYTHQCSPKYTFLGEVSLDELRSFVAGVQETQAERMRNEAALDKIFNMIDDDGSGALDEDERGEEPHVVCCVCCVCGVCCVMCGTAC